MLAAAPNVRTVDDTIRQLEIFIYPFLAGDLLRVSQKPLSTSTRKHILRQALLGLVEIHGKDVVHNGIRHASEGKMGIGADNRMWQISSLTTSWWTTQMPVTKLLSTQYRFLTWMMPSSCPQGSTCGAHSAETRCGGARNRGLAPARTKPRTSFLSG